MKADIGKRYAQILNDKCHWKFDITTLPEWQDTAFQVVDITNYNPEPQEGDLFDGMNFTVPPIPVPSVMQDIVDRIQALPLARKQALKTVIQAILQS